MSRMFKAAQSEQEFLLSLAVDQINRQFGRRTKISEYDIVSIRPVNGYKLGYEIHTKEPNDEVRFRMYLNMGHKDEITRFKDRVEQGFTSVGSLEDEVLISFGTLDTWYVSNKIYAFRPINNPSLISEYIVTEGNERIVLENGEALEL